MLWLLLALLSPIPSDQDAGLTPRFDRSGPYGDCLTPLGKQVMDIRVPVRCTLDGRGVPQGCVIEGETDLSPEQQRAALCIARTVRFENAQGQTATNVPVIVPVRVRLEDYTPPSDANR